MAEFERTAAPDGEPARGVPLRQPAPLSMGGSTEPMQQALDGWYREQPAAFTRAAEPEADGDALDPAERAIALNHLLAYGRLAGERELAAFREDGGKGGGAVAGPLLQRLQTQTMALLNRAPAALHPALGAGLAASNERLAGKAAAIEAALTGRRQAEALEQSVSLGAALLRQDPEQYEILLADAGDMVEGLGLEEGPRQALGQGIRKRLAEAVLLAQADPVVGDPARADQELRRGRFRDAFDAEEIAAWRELMTANRARAAAEAARREQDAGIVAEIKLLNRLGAAGRAEAPMPTAAEIETVFPGEGAARLERTQTALKRRLYQEQRALQPFDGDAAWVEAGEEGEDRLLRTQIAADRDEQFARTGGPMPSALAEAIEEGLQDFSKLDVAIELYQHHLAKLRVPPEKRTLLPRETLTALARQYAGLLGPNEKADWRNRLEAALGEVRSSSLQQALHGLAGGARSSPEAAAPNVAPAPVAADDAAETGAVDPATLLVENVPGWNGRSWAELAAAQGVDPNVLATAELAPPDVRGGLIYLGSPPRGRPAFRNKKLFIDRKGLWRLRPEFSKDLDRFEARYRDWVSIWRFFGVDMAADLLERYLNGDASDFQIPMDWMVSFSEGVRAEAKIQEYFEKWLNEPDNSGTPSERIGQSLQMLMRDGEDGAEFSASSHWAGRIFELGDVEGFGPYLAIGSSVLKGFGRFKFRREGEHIAFEGTVTFQYDEPYNFESSFLDDFPGFESSELIDLERFRGARTFRNWSQWSRAVTGTISIIQGTISLDHVAWGEREAPDPQIEKRPTEDKR
jgi:hypothetical protein